MDTTTRLKVQVWVHNTSAEFPCVLCGDGHEQDLAAASLVKYGEGGRGEMLGDVCPACLAAGPSGAADRARSHAERLRARAEELERLAVAVERMALADWATPEALQEAERDAYRGIRCRDKAEREKIRMKWPNPTPIVIAEQTAPAAGRAF